MIFHIMFVLLVQEEFYFKTIFKIAETVNDLKTPYYPKHWITIIPITRKTCKVHFNQIAAILNSLGRRVSKCINSFFNLISRFIQAVSRLVFAHELSTLNTCKRSGSLVETKVLWWYSKKVRMPSAMLVKLPLMTKKCLLNIISTNAAQWH